MFKYQMRKAILFTVIVTSLVWLLPVVILSVQSHQRDRELIKLKEDISLLKDKDVIQIARKIKNSDYSYEEYVVGYADQVAELETILDGKNSRINTLERQVVEIKDTYKIKLDKMVYEKYHLKNDILSEEQLQMADEIAQIVASNYEEYGVLPSVAVGQAMQESQLGVVCPKNNLWGINTGTYASYPSLYDGVIRYLKVINNGLYDGALFNSDYQSSLYSIQQGGYCVPSDGYADAVSNCITSFNFTDYDDYYLGDNNDKQ